jgi:cell division protein FtsB
MSKSHEAEPEIRGDLQGRIEVFDQSVRSFEKRLRAIERRLSLEAQQTPQASKAYFSNFTDPFPEECEGMAAVGASVFPQGPSVFPEASIPLHGNPLLFSSTPSCSEGNVPGLTLSAVLPSNGSSSFHLDSPDNSSELSGNNPKIKTLNSFISNLLENINSLQASVAELSDFAHKDLKLEVDNLEKELQEIRAQEKIRVESLKKLESRIDIIEDQNRFTLGSIKIPLEISGVAGSLILFFTGFLVWSGRWDIIRTAYFPVALATILAGAVLVKFYILNSKKRAMACPE